MFALSNPSLMNISGHTCVHVVGFFIHLCLNFSFSGGDGQLDMVLDYAAPLYENSGMHSLCCALFLCHPEPAMINDLQVKASPMGSNRQFVASLSETWLGSSASSLPCCVLQIQSV
jgi:hypothetical protein